MKLCCPLEMKDVQERGGGCIGPFHVALGCRLLLELAVQVVSLAASAPQLDIIQGKASHRVFHCHKTVKMHKD